MEALISGLGVAAITGITILAYKHPHAYKKLQIVSTVGKAGIGLFIIMLVWQQAVSKTFIKLMPLIKEASLNEAQKIVDTITPSPYSYLIFGFGFIVAISYFGFLLFLPELLKKETKE
ncbi:MAG TPA: hypothetical protein PKJ10_05190 [Smithella sp.]|nr:hypothetical protein [Smithella sp.]